MNFTADFKYAVRLLLKKPGFTVLTILVMATGISLSVYSFSFLNTIVFKPLPFEDGESLVQVSASQDGMKNASPLDLHDYAKIRRNVEGLSEFGAYKNVNLNLSRRDGAKKYSGIAAESNIFELTRTKPLLGRGFTAGEAQQGAEHVVVIGHDVWQNQFGGDPEVIDQAVRINGETHRIIGVMPEGYLFPFTAEMWVPLREKASQLPRGEGGKVYGLAHLNDQASMEDVNRQLTTIMQRLEQRYPKTNNGVGAYVSTIPMTGTGDGAPTLAAMQVIAFLILLLASINVGSLLLARAMERDKETAIRVALGAPRLRLISQMLWESVIICSLGGVIGLLVVAWGLEISESALASFNPDRPNFWWDFGIDGYTIKLTAVFLLTTIFITGFLPAWKNSGADFNAVLRDGTRGALGKKTGKLTQLMVIAEISVSMMVLIAAGLMAVGVYNAVRADYGTDPEGVMTAQLFLNESNYDSPEKQVQFVKTLESRLQSGSGIGGVMISSALPGEMSAKPTIAVEGREYTDDRGHPRSNYVSIMPGSLDKLGIQLKEGRYFNSGDDGLQKSSVVVTESFASRHFPGESPLGKRVRVVESEDGAVNWLTIVGVVEHAIYGYPAGESEENPVIFRPYTQSPTNQITVGMEVNSNSPQIVRTLRETVSSIDPELPAFRVEPYSEVFHRIAAPILFGTTIFLLFGVAAAILASSGLYGVMSNTINQRTQEVGIKRALGAVDRRITKEFILKGLRQFLWGGIPGLAIGCFMGFGMSQVMGIENGALALVALGVVLLIGATVALAIYIPTKRVLKIEPSQALRCE